MKSTRSKITISEHEIQKVIKEYLELKGWMVLRLNSGKYSVGEGQSKRFIMGQEAGTPDLMAFRSLNSSGRGYTITYFIEVKVPGNKPTALQAAKMEELERYGAKCLIATCIEDVEAL